MNKAAALGFMVKVVKGRWEEGGVAHSFSRLPSSSGKPQAVPCRIPLPYHNGMTNGAMKILEVQWPSLLLSKLPVLQGSTVQLSKLCITDEIDAKKKLP